MNTTGQLITLIPPTDIERSPTNRKHFDKAKFDELVANVRLNGILQAALVRPHPTKAGRYELVFGERRWRAATLLKLPAMPCTVRELNDGEVLELQIAENKEREHLHELDEAELYDQLIKRHGLHANDVANKVGKDVSYVRKRIVLLALSPKAKEAFYEGRISLSIALIIARQPDEKAQAEGLKYSQEKDYDGNLPTALDVAHFLKEKFMHVLKAAPFDIHDAALTSVGACSACPKRTSNQTDLFGEDMKGDDRCLDGGCYKKKQEAWWTRTKATAKQTGQTVVEGKEADAASYDHKYVKLDDKCWEDEKRRTFRQLLAPALKSGQVKPVLARTAREVLHLVTKAEALKHSGLAQAQKHSKADEEVKLQKKAAQRAAELNETVREAKTMAFIDEVERMIVQDPMSTALARLLAQGALNLAGHYHCDRVAKRREATMKGERPVDVLRKVTEDMEMAELLGLVFELCVPVGHDPEDDDELVKVVRVDLDAIERDLRDDAKRQDLAGARSEAAQPARVGKQAKAVTQDSAGKDAPVAKGRAPVSRKGTGHGMWGKEDEDEERIERSGISVGKLADGVLPKKTLWHAYMNKFSDHIYVRLGSDVEDIVELRKSPSIVWVRQGIEAVNQAEAESIAKECHAKGQGEITHGGIAAKQAKGSDAEKGAEMISIPMPKGYTAGIEIREANGGWSSTARVVRPKTSGGVAVPYGCQEDTRQEAFAFAVACVLRILAEDMKTPDALLESVRAWAAKHKVTRADLKRLDAAWKEKHGA